MSKKKIPPTEGLKERLGSELSRFVGRDDLYKHVSMRAEMPYPSVRAWLDPNTDRAVHVEFLSRCAELFPLIDWSFVFTGKVAREIATVTEQKSELLLPADIALLQGKLIHCLETNAKLQDEVYQLKAGK